MQWNIYFPWKEIERALFTKELFFSFLNSGQFIVRFFFFAGNFCSSLIYGFKLLTKKLGWGRKKNIFHRIEFLGRNSFCESNRMVNDELIKGCENCFSVLMRIISLFKENGKFLLSANFYYRKILYNEKVVPQFKEKKFNKILLNVVDVKK